MDGETQVKKYVRRFGALKTERSSFESLWRDVDEHFQPTRARFFASDRNRGDRRNYRLINSAPRRAKRILESGLMAGLTSPSRPWVTLTTQDPDLAEYEPVRNWLDIVLERIRDAHARSNLYDELHTMYGELTGPATGAMLLLEDEDSPMWAHTLPIGSYALATDHRRRPNTLFQEMVFTVGQMCERFDEKKLSRSVLDAKQRGRVDDPVSVTHVIEPNKEHDPERYEGKYRPWRSCWFETAGDDHREMLKVDGFFSCPFVAARWQVGGLDTYGTSSPAIDALGDARQLQILEERKAEVLDKIVRPPMNAPSSMLNQQASLVPSAINFVDAVSGGQSFSPSIQVPPAAMTAAAAEIMEVKNRIEADLYVDLFLMLAETDRRQITAREIAERHEEKMLQLGPALERLQHELLAPIVERTFDMQLRAGNIPPAPVELQGQELKVEFVSIMAQAQKMVAISGIEQTASFAIALAQAKPEVLDKLNGDEMVDAYSEAIGVKSRLINSDEVVAQLRENRAKQQQMAQAAQAAVATADTAHKLSQAKLGDDNALNRMLATLGGPASVPQR